MRNKITFASIKDILNKSLNKQYIKGNSYEVIYCIKTVNRISKKELKMGKKLLLIIIYVSILSVCHSNAQSMNDKWDENNKTYTNYTCGFYWNLHEDLLWTKQPLRQKDAVFGAVDIETRTVAYI